MTTTLDFLQQAMPGRGLFAQKDWLLSPKPLPLPAKLVEQLQRLGHRLHIFQRTSNDLYFRSLSGKAPAWISDYVDAGKSAGLLSVARDKRLRQTLPGVIRPDLIFTESGLALTEIDSVPGGIGLTAWLNETYASAGHEVIGGRRGMLDGFASLFPRGADIAVSKEASDYHPEMEWVCGQLGSEFAVVEAESHQPRRDLYRFFELFDLGNVSHWQEMQEFAASTGHSLTAPMKPWLEEKLWLALFWSRPLRELWRRELRENHRDALAKIIPRSWVVDPAPVPHHATIPGLDLSSWDELAAFSQKERQLVLKLSGFSELAWGSRSVVIGHDVSQDEWRGAVERAVHSFPEHPYVLQEFHKGATVLHPYYDPQTGDIQEMEGRVRLCPYYFVPPQGGRIMLGGVMATIVPADKKIIHGMRDAILAPCSVALE